MYVDPLINELVEDILDLNHIAQYKEKLKEDIQKRLAGNSLEEITSLTDLHIRNHFFFKIDSFKTNYERMSKRADKIEKILFPNEL